jgi:HK97 family phage prohead protease
MTTTFERRTFSEPVEFRAEGTRLMARGYAYVFNTLSQNLGGFVETVAPGAGKKSIQEQDIRALANHDPNLLLGRLGAGTLRMEEDGTGGAYEIDLPDTTVGRDWATLLERGDVYGSSFGFRAIEDDWSETPDRFPLRTLRQFSIRDVGPVTFPAYTSTEAALRSLAECRALDLSEVLAAAERNELRSLISRPADAGEPGETHSLAVRRPRRL